MKLVLLGAPGAGKGTQAKLICERYKLAHISTGDILRDNIRRRTELGKSAQDVMNRGGLVSDDLIIGLVKDRLTADDCKNGYVLDGFPRTINQAECLGKLDLLDKVINIDLSKDIIVQRLAGRLSCKGCTNVTHRDWVQGQTCPQCGGQLYTRDDDKEETILRRFEEYDRATSPLIEYYSAAGKLATVKGRDTKEETFAEIDKVLEDI